MHREQCAAHNGCRTTNGDRQPAVVRQMRIGRHERHSSADRRRCVCGSPLRSRASAPQGKRSDRIVYGSYGSGLQSRALAPRGAYTPAVVLRCERLPAKQRFLRCTNAHSTESGGRQPAVDSCGDALGMHREQCAAHNDCPTTNGGRQLAVVSGSWCRKKCEF
jgi:hypothetical protein